MKDFPDVIAWSIPAFLRAGHLFRGPGWREDPAAVPVAPTTSGATATAPMVPST